MRAVTFQAPGEVRVDDVPEPRLEGPRDAIVRVEASGVCGSDLHIYHGRVKLEPGFVIGHEYVGTVEEVGDEVSGMRPGDRVLGAFLTACGECWFCSRRLFHKCDSSRVFGHGAAMGDLPGAQAELLLVPNAELALRRVPDGLPADVALFAGDVMGTAYHAIDALGLEAGGTAAVLGLGPVGLCAVQVAIAAGAAQVFAVDTVAERLAMAGSFGATPVHLTEAEPVKVVRAATDGRGADGVVDAVGHPDALDMAIRMARKAGAVSATGVYAERAEVHVGLVWIKSLTLRAGQANVIAHLDPVLERLASGALDPAPLVTHHMSLDDAPEAYAVYDRREALKIVLRP